MLDLKIALFHVHVDVEGKMVKYICSFFLEK
jgi:hypothetical protein